MQTDPNWTNFLWNPKTRQVRSCNSYFFCTSLTSDGQIELVDFGATREYSQEFMDNWVRLLSAAAEDDRDGCVKWSRKVGYLTGEETEVSIFMSLHSPFSLQVFVDHARCTCNLHDSARCAIQGDYSTAICIWARNAMG
jgi:hypothetical protein